MPGILRGIFNSGSYRLNLDKMRESKLSLNDFDTIQEYNKTWADLKHYVNIVADMIKENKRAYYIYFNETSTVDDFLKV